MTTAENGILPSDISPPGPSLDSALKFSRSKISCDKAAATIELNRKESMPLHWFYQADVFSRSGGNSRCSGRHARSKKVSDSVRDTETRERWTFRPSHFGQKISSGPPWRSQANRLEIGANPAVIWQSRHRTYDVGNRNGAYSSKTPSARCFFRLIDCQRSWTRPDQAAQLFINGTQRRLADDPCPVGSRPARERYIRCTLRPVREAIVMKCMCSSAIANTSEKYAIRRLQPSFS